MDSDESTKSNDTKRTSRRTLFKTIAAIPCAVGAYLLFDKLTEYNGPPKTFGARPVPTPEPIQHQTDQEEYCFYAVGDTGLASKRRDQVVQQMVQQKRDRLPNSIFLVGDNFYDEGVKSVDDRLWQAHFERPFAESKFPMPFYACLGNHDYRGNIAAQVDYSQLNPRWNMPAPYFSFTEPIGQESSVQFFVLDTTPIHEGDYSTTSQILWLRNALQGCQSQYKIVVGHHPLFTGGEHGRSHRNYRQLVGLFDQFKIDMYVCGHDHDLQLHDTGRGWLHLVTGAGSKLRSVNWVPTTLFAQAASGFSKVTLNRDKMAVEIFTTDGLAFCHQQNAKTLARSG